MHENLSNNLKNTVYKIPFSRYYTPKLQRLRKNMFTHLKCVNILVCSIFEHLFNVLVQWLSCDSWLISIIKAKWKNQLHDIDDRWFFLTPFILPLVPDFCHNKKLANDIQLCFKKISFLYFFLKYVQYSS